MSKTRKRRQLTNKKKRLLIINGFLTVFLFLGVGFAALSTNLNIFGSVTVKRYEEPTLYNVMRNIKMGNEPGVNNTLINEYDGDHQDSMNPELSNEKIYYWNTKTNAQVNQALNKNNVIFANHCWQFFRTTDTGGVKMIYNGEVVDGKCLSNRGKHPGYTSAKTEWLNDYYWYGTDYTYNSSTKKFKISGDTEAILCNASTGEGLVGKYTCKSTTETEECSTLYFVESYRERANAYVIPIDFNSHYSQFGEVQFSPDRSGSGKYSLASVGYMYNKSYDFKSSNGNAWGSIYKGISPIMFENYNIVENDETYPFTYDESSNEWISTMTKKDNSAVIKFKVTTSDYYTLNYTISSDSYDYAAFYKNNHLLREISGNLSASIDLGQLTTEDEITVEYSKDYYSSSFGDDNVKFSIGVANEVLSDNRYQFANDVNYSGGEYTLLNTIAAEITDNLSSSHYTCLSSNNRCSKVYYIYRINENKAYYIELENGKKVEDAIAEMLSADDVNTKDSLIKSAVEAWFEKYLLSYSDYLEDTIFCYDRSIVKLAGWNPNGGSLSDNLRYNGYNGNNNLRCNNETDRFNTENPKAKTKYKVGLLTSSEIYITSNGAFYNPFFKTEQLYWLGTPAYLNYGEGIYNHYVYTGGSLYTNSVSYTNGLRPVISLKHNIEYASGDGSAENPYIVPIRD